jgi:hypothetical protein
MPHTFEDFCSHWKENHRILVQRRLVWETTRGEGLGALGPARPGSSASGAWRVKGPGWAGLGVEERVSVCGKGGEDQACGGGGGV